MNSISSLQNKSIKHLLLLQEKARLRKKEGLFVVEGFREINLALTAQYRFSHLYICTDFCRPEHVSILQQHAEITVVSPEVYQKIAYRNRTEGIVGIAKCRPHDLHKIQLPENPLILVAEAPEKPGNIGALLRTADAAQLDAVLIANPKTDVYNPNIIRSSVGCVFTNQIGVGNTSEIIHFLHQKNIGIYTAILQEAQEYTSQNFTKPSAIIVGTEADGLSDEWRKTTAQPIIIPMEGSIDSMNVSVAAGILVFEAKRQRKLLLEPV